MVKVKNNLKKIENLNNLAQSDEEEFVKVNEFLINESLNDEENLDRKILEERDEELFEKLKSIDRKNIKRLRTEVVNDELDVNIISNRNDSNSVYKIKTHELLHSLKNSTDASQLKKIFAKAHKRTKVLDTPVPKHISEKALRVATYIEDKKEVSQWDPVIKKNRRAEQIVFPLKQPNYSLQTASTFSKTWKPETELEKQVAELLESSENNLKNQKYLTEAELKAVKTMNLDDIKQKRAEFLKLKALQRYQEAKFKRIKNIKSKRYRKILRKEKEKQDEKNLEKLEKDDPIQFKEVIDQLEKNRMKERMSLKHKNTSKWAKQQAKYAKYSDRAREQVQEQLELSKQLTKKVKQLKPNEDEDSDEDVKENDMKSEANGLSFDILNSNGLLKSNPWLKMMGDVGNVKQNNDETNVDQEDYSKPKAFTNEKEKVKAQQEIDDDEDEDDSNDEIEIDDKAKNSEVADIFKNGDESDEDIDEAIQVEPAKKQDDNKKVEEQVVKATKKVKKIKKAKQNDKEIVENDTQVESVKKVEFEETNIEPMKETKKINTPSSSTQSEKQIKHQITLSEAFADDDVIDEFKAEKQKIIEKERVKPIDLRIPGWGEWAGTGIDPNEQKKKKKARRGNKRFSKPLIIKPEDVLKTDEDKQQMLRRDKDLSHVIISEKKDAKIASFQINELPHQFKNVDDFERKISQPIGRTWNPEQKFRKLTQLKVKTKIGTIIQPIDKDDIIKNIKNSKK